MPLIIKTTSGKTFEATSSLDKRGFRCIKVAGEVFYPIPLSKLSPSKKIKVNDEALDDISAAALRGMATGMI